VSESNSPWVSLTARIVRVVLARKDVSYATLAKGLAAFGHTEDEKALAARVALGRVRLSLLLQILCVTRCEVPRLWKDNLSSEDSWETRAQAVIEAELAQCPMVDMNEVTSKLVALGAGFSERTLANHVGRGELFMPVFLRLLVILRSPSLELFIDYADLIAAVSLTMQDGHAITSL
jgi:hypothetical protein